MNRLIWILLLGVAWAQSTTPNLGLAKPAHNDPNWDVPVNHNMDLIDAWSATVAGAASTNIRYVNATNYMWTQSPGADLSAAGAKTITLTPCPRGVDGADTWNYVRIATTGTPEDVQITGGTCIGGAASGTITVTTTQTHSAGYTVASSTQGWQEASNDARFTVTNPTGNSQSGVVVGGPGEYTWTATMTVRSAQQTLDFSGTIIGCNMSAACLFLGSSNANSFPDIRVFNFRGRPMIANGTYPMIEDNGNGAKIDGVTTRNGLSGGTFGYDIQVDNDQAADISHLDSSLGSPNIRCDATFCGSSIYAPGPFATNAAVGYVHENNISPQCAGNGIDWQAGNTLRVENTVIQGFAQFGIRAGGASGGFGQNVYHNVYMEVGACSNPAGNIGIAGLINQGQLATITGGEGPVGTTPIFNSQGGTRRNYFIVVHDSVLGTSVPLFAGYGTPTSGTITVTWPQVTGTNTVTYDVLATSGVPGTTVPSIIPIGTANQAVHGAVGISGSCSNGICTATDTFATALDSYAVPAFPTYFPLLKFWPGNIILTTPGDATNGDTVAGVVGTFAGGGVIITENWMKPTIFATDCSVTSLYSPTFSSCLAWSSSQNGVMPGATILQDGAEAGVQFLMAGTKGRLMFNPGTATVPTRHIITLVDSARQKTFSTPNQRPTYDAADSYIGIDQDSGNQLSNVGIAFGAPISLSNYIGSNPDGSAYLERLTSALKTFNTPLKIFNYIDIPETAAPANPAANTQRFYADSTAHTLKCLLSSGSSCISSGSATWGTITGTLSSQTDLQNALNLLAPLISPSFTTPALGAATGTSITLPDPGGSIFPNLIAASTPTSGIQIGTTNTTLVASGVAVFGTNQTTVNRCGGVDKLCVQIPGTYALAWPAAALYSSNTDGGISRGGAAATMAVGNGQAGNTTGKIKASGLISAGTKFTSNAGCTESATVGGATAGKFTVGQGTACTVVITMGDTATSANGWSCWTNDQTAVPAVAIRQTASTTTTASLLMTVATNDVVSFGCVGY